MVTALLCVANAIQNLVYAISKKEESDLSTGISLVLIIFSFTLDLLLFFRIYSYLGR